ANSLGVRVFRLELVSSLGRTMDLLLIAVNPSPYGVVPKVGYQLEDRNHLLRKHLRSRGPSGRSLGLLQQLWQFLTKGGSVGLVQFFERPRTRFRHSRHR